MGDANKEALARRAVACKGWKWLPGMRLFGRHHHPARATIAVVCDATVFIADGGRDSRGICDRVEIAGLDGDWLPDLDDPATIGCLLALVREAWNEDRIVQTASQDGDWFAYVATGEFVRGPTEAEALVVALEAAEVDHG